MKIEIILSEDINEKCQGRVCFEYSEFMQKELKQCSAIKGVVIIDNEPYKFSFNPSFQDGDVFNTGKYYDLVKSIIPNYMYANLERFKRISP